MHTVYFAEYLSISSFYSVPRCIVMPADLFRPKAEFAGFFDKYDGPFKNCRFFKPE